MLKLRFNIASLLGVILILGVGFAALRESSDLWESGVFTLTLAALLITILFAVHRIESRRAFWIGFALFGWIYLGLSLFPSIESRLITTKALAFLDSEVPRSIPAGVTHVDFDNDGKLDLLVVNNSQPNALYRNQGNVVFEDVTAVAGLNPAGKEVMGEWMDLECPGGTSDGGFKRHDRELREDRSLVSRLDRRNPGRAAFPSSSCQEAGENVRTVQP